MGELVAVGPIPLGRPLLGGRTRKEDVGASHSQELQKYHAFAFLMNTRGGFNGRSNLDLRDASASNEAKRAATAEAARKKREESAAWRSRATHRIHAAVLSAKLASLLVLSPDAEAGSEDAPLSEAQQLRVRSQSLAVSTFYRLIDEKHACSLDFGEETENLLDIADIAVTQSHVDVGASTVYRWHLEFVQLALGVRTAGILNDKLSSWSTTM